MQIVSTEWEQQEPQWEAKETAEAGHRDLFSLGASVCEKIVSSSWQLQATHIKCTYKGFLTGLYKSKV